MTFSLLLSFSLESDLGSSIKERSSIREHGRNDNSSTRIRKTNLIVFAYNPKQTITYVIRTIIYIIYLEQFFAVIVDTNDFTLSCANKSYGRDRVRKGDSVFLASYYRLPQRILVTDIISVTTFKYSLCF